ncbi:hypothetical protein CTEN210_17707 [Chaetoceros tenuissimus]|uniref:Uncharacterized protein n=1 Tax=Chaetoceros tenuissimus TaxID=426638 RepID=A0AAD3HFC2_9STRA|nr:hypothetical protein CTEN210_17707 [Chaetoceros tenuissimus]
MGKEMYSQPIPFSHTLWHVLVLHSNTSFLMEPSSLTRETVCLTTSLSMRLRTIHHPRPRQRTIGINTPERLGLEATMVSQNFAQQILTKSKRKEFGLPNPFNDEGD